MRNLVVAPELRKLYSYLVERGFIEQLDGYRVEYLHIFSRDILRKIKSADPAWLAMVPAPVAEVIQQRGFFGYAK